VSIEYLEMRRKAVRKFILKIILGIAVLDAVLLMVLAWSCYGS
jgi:hypothetical protein